MTAAYDLLSPEHFAAPYETFALMRENDPLYWHEQMGMWFATRYQDVHALIRDKRFSSARSTRSCRPMRPGSDRHHRRLRLPGAVRGDRAHVGCGSRSHR
jgi:cytochrome P450